MQPLPAKDGNYVGNDWPISPNEILNFQSGATTKFHWVWRVCVLLMPQTVNLNQTDRKQQQQWQHKNCAHKSNENPTSILIWFVVMSQRRRKLVLNFWSAKLTAHETEGDREDDVNAIMYMYVDLDAYGKERIHCYLMCLGFQFKFRENFSFSYSSIHVVAVVKTFGRTTICWNF